MEGREVAELRCSSCGAESEHLVRYAGRVLVSVQCTSCGYTWHHADADLRHVYVHDLRLRAWSKPRRWLRRLRRRPVGTVLGLPGALAAQPVKFARELVAVLRR